MLRCAPRPQGPAGCPPRCLSRLPDADRRQARCGLRSVFIYGNNRYILFIFCRAGGGRAGAGLGRRGPARTPRAVGRARRRREQVSAGGAMLLPLFLCVGASTDFGRERAGGTIGVRKRGGRRGRNSPGRKWASPCACSELAGRGGTISERRGFWGTSGHTCAVPILPSKDIYITTYISTEYIPLSLRLCLVFLVSLSQRPGLGCPFVLTR